MKNRDHDCSPIFVIVCDHAEGSGNALTKKEFDTTMSKVSESLDRIENKIAELTSAESTEDANAVAAQAKIAELQAEIDRLNALPTISDADQARLDGLEQKLADIKAGEQPATSPEPTV